MYLISEKSSPLTKQSRPRFFLIQEFSEESYGQKRIIVQESIINFD